MTGGVKGGLACPDNLAFDKNGNLWIDTDIADSAANKYPYKEFGNNGLYYVPMSGPNAGDVLQVASAPIDAELTGICFLPDNETMLLSVQHPGAQTKDLSKPTSQWPDGDTPKPAVVTISGETLKSLLA